MTPSWVWTSLAPTATLPVPVTSSAHGDWEAPVHMTSPAEVVTTPPKVSKLNQETRGSPAASYTTSRKSAFTGKVKSGSSANGAPPTDVHTSGAWCFPLIAVTREPSAFPRTAARVPLPAVAMNPSVQTPPERRDTLPWTPTATISVVSLAQIAKRFALSPRPWSLVQIPFLKCSTAPNPVAARYSPGPIAVTALMFSATTEGRGTHFPPTKCADIPPSPTTIQSVSEEATTSL